MNEKQMYGVTIEAMLVVGFLGGYLVREIATTAGKMISYSCTHEGKTYKNGASFPAGDRCNSCSCQKGNVSCTAIGCDQEDSGTDTGVVSPVLPGQSEMAKIPDQRLTTVPEPNIPVPVKYVVEHRSALDGKTVYVKGVVVANWLTQETCSGEGCVQVKGYMQPSIFLADTADQSRNQLYDVRVIVPGGGQLPALPYSLYVLRGNDFFVTGDEGSAVCQRCGNDHAVSRIFMERTREHYGFCGNSSVNGNKPDTR